MGVAAAVRAMTSTTDATTVPPHLPGSLRRGDTELDAVSPSRMKAVNSGGGGGGVMWPQRRSTLGLTAKYMVTPRTQIGHLSADSSPLRASMGPVSEPTSVHGGVVSLSRGVCTIARTGARRASFGGLGPFGADLSLQAAQPHESAILPRFPPLRRSSLPSGLARAAHRYTVGTGTHEYTPSDLV